VQDRGPDIIELTVTFWQERTELPVSSEDARQIIANVTGFFLLLGEWDRQDQQKPLPLTPDFEQDRP
jgi:hypothetical protein